MAVDIPSSTAQPAPGAKARILATADRLFYEEGIHHVGVDRLISDSAVTKATFYKHYGSKDTLILAYVTGRSDAVRERMRAILAAHPDPAAALRRVFDDAIAEIQSPRSGRPHSRRSSRRHRPAAGRRLRRRAADARGHAGAARGSR